MASQPTSMRRARERDLVRATRALFDERGLQDAPIEEIAQAVGIARGLIYRQFSSKEELYFLTVTDYLQELATELIDAAAGSVRPVLPALPRVPGQRADADEAPDERAAGDRLGGRLAAARPGDRALRRAP